MEQWNSAPENSSYYNQPTHKPYGQTFGTASTICGALALVTTYIPFVAIPVGSLGLLFGALSYRKVTPAVASDGTLIKKKKRIPFGLVLSAAGVIISLIATVYALMALPQLLQDPAFMEQMDATMQQMYGMDFQEVIDSLKSSFSNGGAL